MRSGARAAIARIPRPNLWRRSSSSGRSTPAEWAAHFPRTQNGPRLRHRRDLAAARAVRAGARGRGHGADPARRSPARRQSRVALRVRAVATGARHRAAAHLRRPGQRAASRACAPTASLAFDRPAGLGVAERAVARSRSRSRARSPSTPPARPSARSCRAAELPALLHRHRHRRRRRQHQRIAPPRPEAAAAQVRKEVERIVMTDLGSQPVARRRRSGTPKSSAGPIASRSSCARRRRRHRIARRRQDAHSPRVIDLVRYLGSETAGAPIAGYRNRP